MSTQYATGEDYTQYQAGITAGVPTVLGHVAAITAYSNTAASWYKALNKPVSNTGGANLAMPSIALNVANNLPFSSILTGGPQRYTY